MKQGIDVISKITKRKSHGAPSSSQSFRVSSLFLGMLFILSLLIPGAAIAAPGITSDKASPHYSNFVNMETFEDLRIKVLGGDVRMTRRWTGSHWVWNTRWDDLAVDREQSLYHAQLAWIKEGSGNVAKNPALRIRQNTPSIIYRAGQVYRRVSQGGGRALYENQMRQFITMTNSGFSWKDSKGNTVEYDYYGRLLSYADRNGVAVYLERDDAGYVTAIKDHHKNTVLHYSWEAIPNSESFTNLKGHTALPQRLTGLTDYTDRSVSYLWDSNNRLTEIIDVLGSSWQLRYSSSGQLTEILDPLERATKYSIGLNGRFNSRIDADGVGVSYIYSYNSEDKEYYVQEKHTSGRVNESWFNAMGMLIREGVNGEQNLSKTVVLSNNSTDISSFTQCYNTKAIYWYRGSTLVNIDWIIGGPRGNLSQDINETEHHLNIPTDMPACGTPLPIKQEITTDARGGKTVQEFDQWRNVISQTNPDGSRTQTTWNNTLGLPLRVTNEMGVVTLYEYDTRGNLITLTEASGTTDERITRFTYDQYGQQLTKTTGESAANNTALATTTYEYDEYGNVLKEIDPMGGITTYSEYDALGNAHRLKDARANAEGADYHWTKNYDATGNLLSDLDPYGEGTIYLYNSVGDVTQISEYGVIDQINSNASGLPLTLTDANGYITRFSYNLQSLPTSITDAMGHVHSNNYDNQDRLEATIDGEGNITRYRYQHDQLRIIQHPNFNEELVYDSKGQLTSTHQRANNLSYNRNTAYDAIGQRIRTTDAKGNIKKYTYDSLGRVLMVVDAQNSSTKFSYDARNNLVQVIDPEGTLTTYNYNLNDNMTTENLAGSQRIYTYDNNNNLVSHTNAQDETTIYTYDYADRLVNSTSYTDSTITQPVKVTNYNYKHSQLSGYNQIPGAASTTDALSLSESYNYNLLGQLTDVSVNLGGINKSYSYTYYPNGLTKTYTNPEGIIYTYYYNKNNQLTAVHIPNNGQLIYSDFNWLAPQTLLLPGGTSITLRYNDFLNVIERFLKDPTGVDLDWAIYQYDLESNIEKIQTQRGDYNFIYDNMHRLTEADYPETTTLNNEAFIYNKLGNRTYHEKTASNGEEADNSLTTLIYNDRNQLIQTSKESGIVNFTYNANGHTKTKTENGQTTEYIYNLDERLIEVKINGQTIANYTYNPYGQRIQKTINGNTTYYLYNKNGLAGEYNSTGALIKEYHFHPQKTWMTDPLFQRTENNQIYYYQNDHIGTPQRMVNNAGVTVWQANYNVFGEATILANSIAENNLRLPGQYYDQETDLHHNYFRDYNPKLGRYIQSDPIGLAGGINTFAYVGGNPLRFFDPLGLMSTGHKPDMNLLPSCEKMITADNSETTEIIVEGAAYTYRVMGTAAAPKIPGKKRAAVTVVTKYWRQVSYHYLIDTEDVTYVLKCKEKDECGKETTVEIPGHYYRKNQTRLPDIVKEWIEIDHRAENTMGRKK